MPSRRLVCRSVLSLTYTGEPLFLSIPCYDHRLMQFPVYLWMRCQVSAVIDISGMFSPEVKLEFF